MKQFLASASGFFLGILIFEWFSPDRITGVDALRGVFISLVATAPVAWYARRRSRNTSNQVADA